MSYTDDSSISGLEHKKNSSVKKNTQSEHLKPQIFWHGVNELRAEGNADAITALLLESAETGKTLKPPAVEIPLDKPILLPQMGGFIWDCPSGFKLRPCFSDKRGFVTQRDLTKPIEKVTISGLRIEPEINPKTGNPYEGNGFVFNLKNSMLPGLRVENYWNDQAFLVALYDCIEVDDWYFYTEHAVAGTGGIRLVGGANTTLKNVSGQSGDDSVQFVPVNAPGSPLFNLRTDNCKYVGGQVASIFARAIAAIVDTNVTEGIYNCSFSSIQGKARHRGVVVSARNGVIDHLTADGSVVDLSLDDGRQPEAVLVDGRVENSHLELTIEQQPRKVLTVDSFENTLINQSFTPKKNTISVKATHGPRLDHTQPTVQLKDGMDNRVLLDIIAPHGSFAVWIGGGSGFQLVKSRIRGVAAGQYGIRLAGGKEHGVDETIVEGQGKWLSCSPELKDLGQSISEQLEAQALKPRPIA